MPARIKPMPEVLVVRRGAPSAAPLASAEGVFVKVGPSKRTDDRRNQRGQRESIESADAADEDLDADAELQRLRLRP